MKKQYTSAAKLPFVEPQENAAGLRAANRLSPEDVAFGVSPEEITAVDDGRSTFDIIGQPRALRALRMALEMRGKGYNVFVTGMSGTGKRTAVQSILEEFAADTDRLHDIACVYNFDDPDRPRVLYFPPGEGREFRQAIRRLMEAIRSVVVVLSDNPTFKQERDRLVLEVEDKENAALSELEEQLSQDGFRIVHRGENGEKRTDLLPLRNGRPVDFNTLQEQVNRGKLDRAEWEAIRARYMTYMDQLNRTFARLRYDRDEAEQQIRTLRIEKLRPEIDELLNDVRERFHDDRVHAYLAGLREDVLQNLELFAADVEENDDERKELLQRYDVNVLVDQGGASRAPVIFERRAQYADLFGSQEVLQEPGSEPRSSFMMLRAGAVLRASGGYLILRAEDVVPQEEVWNELKRTLEEGTAEIRGSGAPGSHGGPVKPEPIALDLKVILLGGEALYDILFYNDDDFTKLFKVPAEFDSVMPRTPDTLGQYVRFMRMIEEEEGLTPLTPEGMAAVVEYGVRLAEIRDKLSTRFSLIADLLREASYWAGKLRRQEMDREVVERALWERQYLHNMPEEKIDEQILSGELLIDVERQMVGRINGIAIVDRGYYAFARPVLITARTAPGDDGIINIERESGLSGEIHDKGIYILQGFLQAKYARDFPLSIHASLAFEQSYVEVDGDSASSAEVYALLSAITEIPLRQDIAVTGSVNQMGQIQPVGGISEKVEGFYAICRKVGLTGEQGIIIPRKNVPNLILSREAQEAVAEGRYHIYVVDTLDEGLEILTGKRAGAETGDGGFASGSVNDLVQARLREMARTVKEFEH